MYATIHSYHGVDQNRTAELTEELNETLVPQLTELPGFAGYYFVDVGNGIFTWLGLFETPEQAKESTKLVATWIRDEKLDRLMPNEPKITSGKVFARSSERVLVATLELHPMSTRSEQACRALFARSVPPV